MMTMGFWLVLGLFLDQASKLWIEHHVQIGQQFPVIDGLFKITHVKNSGIAFGLFQGYGDTLRRLFSPSPYSCSSWEFAMPESPNCWVLPSGASLVGRWAICWTASCGTDGSSISWLSGILRFSTSLIPSSFSGRSVWVSIPCFRSTGKRNR